MGRHKTSITISVRVPIALKERIDNLAQKRLMSTNKWLLNLLLRETKPR